MRKKVWVILVIAAMPLMIVAQNKNKRCQPVPKNQNVEDQLRTVYDRFLESIKDYDLEKFRCVTTDEYVFTPDRNPVITREERIKDIESRQTRYEIFKTASAKFSIYKKAAVGNIMVEQKTFNGNKVYTNNVRVSAFFVKIKGNWLIASTHTALVEENK
jgi:hypothetical protein